MTGSRDGGGLWIRLFLVVVVVSPVLRCVTIPPEQKPKSHGTPDATERVLLSLDEAKSKGLKFFSETGYVSPGQGEKPIRLVCSAVVRSEPRDVEYLIKAANGVPGVMELECGPQALDLALVTILGARPLRTSDLASATDENLVVIEIQWSDRDGRFVFSFLESILRSELPRRSPIGWVYQGAWTDRNGKVLASAQSRLIASIPGYRASLLVLNSESTRPFKLAATTMPAVGTQVLVSFRRPTEGEVKALRPDK